MGSRNFQKPFSILDKIASQTHTVTLAAWYRLPRQPAVCAHWLEGPTREKASGKARAHSPLPQQEPPSHLISSLWFQVQGTP